MRKLITKEEIDSLLGAVKDASVEWINDRKKRTELFEGIIKSNDILGILRLIGCLYVKREELMGHGGNKRLAFSDQEVLERAERLIEDEFSFVLGIPKTDISEYIKSRIDP
jgi:CarD family transcriptional regulator